MSEKINIVLDATMLDMFQLCMQRFNYRFNLNKETPLKAKPLDRGTVVHLGLETYYSNLQKHEPFEQCVDSMLIAASKAGRESDLEPDVVQRCLDVLEENVAFWRTADQRFEILEVERSFSYVLHEDESIRIIMIGKIDLLINDNIYSNLPVDHKSHDRESQVIRLSNQFMNYCVATKSNFLLVNKIGFQTSLKPVDKYKRVPVSYDTLILDEWKNNVIQWVNQYLSCSASGIWPMNFTSCTKFNRPCDYIEICESSGQEAKQFKLEANFKTGEAWDVSKQLSKKE